MKRRTTLIAAACAGIAALAAAAALRQPAERAPEKAVYDLAAVIDSALADPGRAAQKADDERRKPRPLIALSGVKPGDRVLDLIPGDGYWTRIFSRIAGPDGKVYAVWPQNYARHSVGKVQNMKGLSASPDWRNVATMVEDSTTLTAPEPLDLVWTSQNYHDYPDEFMGHTEPGILNRAVFAMLKPGGVYMVIDHAAAAGRGMADTEKLHRIDPATVKAQVEAAGFRFEGASEVLANPADPLDIPVFDEKIRGHTSKFAFKFRKPEAGK
jgi:predicted methyltransferase